MKGGIFCIFFYKVLNIFLIFMYELNYFIYLLLIIVPLKIDVNSNTCKINILNHFIAVKQIFTNEKLKTSIKKYRKALAFIPAKEISQI